MNDRGIITIFAFIRTREKKIFKPLAHTQQNQELQNGKTIWSNICPRNKLLLCGMLVLSGACTV